MIIFFFEFVYVVDYVDGFPYIEPSLHPWDEAYLIVVFDRFDVFLDSFGKNFSFYFCISVHKEDWSKILFFFVWSLCGLGISRIVDSLNDLGSAPSVSILWNSLKSTSIKSPLKD
jgi:hypothetical protein